MTKDQEKICERNLFAAYVDGELDTDLTLLFEDHPDGCAECRAELRAHRLFVCELDAVMTDKVEIPVPDNFSKEIAVRATSDLSGVRSRAEHRKAIVICVILALTGFGFLGATARDSVLALIGKFLTSVFSIGAFVSNTVYDGVAGLVVISRVLGHKIVIESGSFSVLLVVLAAAILILSRLISNYHRTGATE